MRVIAGLLALAVLAGCGADGAPIKPSANLGVSITPSGITPKASVGVRKGPVNVTISR